MLAGMEKRGLNVWHKLGLAGLFCVLIVTAVGEEDKPGLLAIAKKSGEERALSVRDDENRRKPPKEAQDSWYRGASAPLDQKTAPKPKIEAERSLGENASPFGNYQARSSSSSKSASRGLAIGGITPGQTVRRGDPSPNTQSAYPALSGDSGDELDDESEWETLY